MMEPLILKYLNPSPATAKGNTKHPRHGICSTWPKGSITDNVPLLLVAQIAPPVLPIIQEVPVYLGPAYRTQSGPNIIVDKGNESVANVFCFGAFADQNSGIVYHNLMGSFPFMSYNGSVCFLVLYHYKSNCILATPIGRLDNMSIFQAYKTYFKDLSAKGYKPNLNIMDNQATKHIKKFLTKNDCKLQVIEPHNHCVNAAKRTIQTFKAAFITALATTNSNFPLQLWDKLTPQVQDTLNMLQASQINPTKSAYEILNGP
jgi:hypothetical protein